MHWNHCLLGFERFSFINFLLLNIKKLIHFKFTCLVKLLQSYSKIRRAPSFQISKSFLKANLISAKGRTMQATKKATSLMLGGLPFLISFCKGYKYPISPDQLRNFTAAAIGKNIMAIMLCYVCVCKSTLHSTYVLQMYRQTAHAITHILHSSSFSWNSLKKVEDFFCHPIWIRLHFLSLLFKIQSFQQMKPFLPC